MPEINGNGHHREVNGESPSKTGIELLQEFEQSGDGKPFEEIVRRYAAMVFGVCMDVTRNAHDAEDATQATFLSLAMQARTHNGIRFLGPWLQQVAHRVSLDLRKSRKRRIKREERHGEAAHKRNDTNGKPHPVDVEELRLILRDELNKLPAKYRLPLILHYFGGLKADEISKELGCKPKTLTVRLFRGRRMLAEMLADRGVSVSAGTISLVLAMVVRQSITDTMVFNTSHAAARVASHGITANVVSSHIAGLVKVGMRSSFFTPAKIAVAIALVACSTFAASSQKLWHVLPKSWSLPEVQWKWQDFLNPLLDGLKSSRPNLRVDGTDPANGEVPVQPAFYTVPLPRALLTAALVAPRMATSMVTSSHKPAVSAPPPIVAAQTAPPPSPESHDSASRDPKTAVSDGVDAEVRTIPFRNYSPVVQANSPDAAGPSSQQPPPATPKDSNPSVPKTSSGVNGNNGGDTTVVKLPERTFDYSPPPLPTLFASASQNGSRLIEPTRTISNAIIADGATGTLDLSTAGKFTSVGDNKSSDKGWFARNGGELILPRIEIRAGTHSYIWGDDAKDPNNSLVNSVNLTANDAQPGSLQLTLLDKANPLVPTLPDGHHFIGIWKLDTDAVVSGGYDLKIRYDSARAQQEGLDESILKLWEFDGQWIRVNDATFWRDLDRHWIGGHVSGTITYFAVSAPEPTGVALVLGAGAWLLSRRRRRS